MAEFQIINKFFPPKLVTFLFCFSLHLERYCAFCFMVGFCSLIHWCLSLFLCSYLLMPLLVCVFLLVNTFHSLCVLLLLDTSLAFVVWCFLKYFFAFVAWCFLKYLFVDSQPFLCPVTFVPLLLGVSSSSPLSFNLVLPPAFFYFCRCERVGSFLKLEECEGSFEKDEIVDV